MTLSDIPNSRGCFHVINKSSTVSLNLRFNARDMKFFYFKKWHSSPGNLCTMFYIDSNKHIELINVCTLLFIYPSSLRCGGIEGSRRKVKQTKMSYDLGEKAAGKRDTVGLRWLIKRINWEGNNRTKRVKMHFLLKYQSICRISGKYHGEKYEKCQKFIFLEIVLAKVKIVTKSFEWRGQKGW